MNLDDQIRAKDAHRRELITRRNRMAKQLRDYRRKHGDREVQVDHPDYATVVTLIRGLLLRE